MSPEPPGKKFARVVRRRAISDPSESVLTLSARPSLPPDLEPEFRRRLGAVDDWNEVLRLAEQHGVGPLLYRHLTTHAGDLPRGVLRRFRALYVRHRHLNGVRLEVLVEVLTALERAGIDTIVLKGQAIADAVYDDDGCRPFADLDLLVPASEAVTALKLLGTLGFDGQFEQSPWGVSLHHHLPGVVRISAGTPVQVELHRDAMSVERDERLTFDDVGREVERFEVRGHSAQRLSPNLMLVHLCCHLTGLWHPIRLIWIADIVGCAERYRAVLNWDRLRSRYPVVRSTLELVHSITPLSDELLRDAGLNPAPVADAGADYAGWPRSTALAWDGWSARRRFLRQTLAPPEWWLRLNYGVGAAPGARGHARRRHYAALARMAGRLLFVVVAAARPRRGL